jgi:hypothetical protein
MGYLMGNYYVWENLENFEIWHNKIKLEIGLPKLSIDQFGNECLPYNENYTDAVIVNDKIIAYVGNEYAADLSVTELRPIRSFVAQS